MSFKDGTFFNYTYDEMGNITSVCENGELVARYTYDDLSRLVREDNKRLNKTVVFVYDNNGNILVRREYAFTLVSQATLACTTEVPVTHLYVYDGDRLISYDDQTFYYTSMSCPEVYIGKEMDWDKDGRLMACYTRDNKVISFTYDSHGRRVSKTVGGVTTNFIYNKDGNLIYQSSGEDTIQFLYDHTGVMGMKINNGTYLYRKNAQGDIIAIDNGANKPMVEYIYDAWGNHEIRINAPLDSTDYTLYNEIAQANPFRYRSYYFDTETGFYYLPARYYDPAIGRFINADSLEYLDPETIGGLNLYAYCGNNPVMYADPSGHVAILTLLIGALIGAAVSFASSVISQSTTDDKEINWGQVALDTIIGGISGALGASGVTQIVSIVAGGILGVVGSIGGDLIASNGDWSKVNIGKAVLMGTIGAVAGSFTGAGAQNTKAMNGAINAGKSWGSKAFLKSAQEAAIRPNSGLVLQTMYINMAKAISKYTVQAVFNVSLATFGTTFLGNAISW